MRKIYLSLLAILALSTAVSAQRNIDVRLQLYYELAQPGQTSPTAALAPITSSTVLIFDSTDTQKAFLGFQIINEGLTPADSITFTDTLHVMAPGNFAALFNIPFGADDSSGIWFSTGSPYSLYSSTLPFYPWDDSTVGKFYPYDWCDSVWVTSDVNDPNPIDETGRFANNHHCESVTLENPWRNFNTGIGGISIGGNGMIVSPNPSSGNMKVLFKFDNNSSGIITITDVAGKTVYTQQLGANLGGLQTIPVNTQGLPEGLYSLRLATGNKVAIQKIYIRN
jgi:hypothetical protein